MSVARADDDLGWAVVVAALSWPTSMVVPVDDWAVAATSGTSRSSAHTVDARGECRDLPLPDQGACAICCDEAATSILAPGSHTS